MPPTQAPTAPTDDAPDDSPGLVLCFNMSDPTGAGGLSADVAAVAAVGGHALPVTTGVLVRDSAEIFDSYAVDVDVVIEQARAVLEDGTIHAFKVGNLENVEAVSAVAELLADYPDTPVVTYVGNLAHVDEQVFEDYLSAVKELLVPQSYVLCGTASLLAQLLLPDWDAEQPPTPWQLVQATTEAGCEHLLVTGLVTPDGYIENILLSAESVLVRERFERFDVSFVGAGDTLSAALAGMLTGDVDLPQATSEALSFLDQSLESGFRPGMGLVIPDRFFWAQPPQDELPDDEAGFPPSRLQ
ncbi:MAG: bifunctional hydroxymethylpyrimidine kinase/phosphomethylpyrimidine kinase [Betaproteobacteria bacterium]|nr:bifunctional hydroxymethylpyrimidine kinase/phosphomethylpyrimidine kinase [Betaproteobacteria bacterium]